MLKAGDIITGGRYSSLANAHSARRVGDIWHCRYWRHDSVVVAICKDGTVIERTIGETRHRRHSTPLSRGDRLVSRTDVAQLESLEPDDLTVLYHECLDDNSVGITLSLVMAEAMRRGLELRSAVVA